MHPLSYVLRAMNDLHVLRLTLSQEPNHIHVHERHFFQVQNQLRSILLELLLQFPDMLRLKATNQADRGLTAVRVLFNPHCSFGSIHASASQVEQIDCQEQLIE